MSIGEIGSHGLLYYTYIEVLLDLGLLLHCASQMDESILSNSCTDRVVSGQVNESRV